ncbi:hypothetical protein KPL35_17095 [Clostridium sp. CF011]|uniref:DUF2268 domain-containing putative Zn-dependent protease n=1 Tax=Clostridium sp. CF011 TaxID=2843318 RepID=UPI001C0DE599|nr:DUF2268 domain-containing putative Zn-dependent protease [Clostridium sp. CF011]MBU3093763.1 hypothetical protein [Clostridium sp. CF011]WAG71232.1 DUF2268 domain-containing putative Zn-dependent protease [Clostridium sp. CF011]
MKVTAIRSDEIYKKMISSKLEQRDDIYRYELMKPFEFKWSCIGIPIKADQSGGYDVVMASSMGGGFSPSQINRERLNNNDFNKLSAFLYGDEIMAMRGVKPVGMPYCAGYACGYYLIKHYLKKTVL